VKVGLAEVDPVQVGPLKVGLAEISRAEDDLVEVGATKIDTAKIDTMEVEITEIRAGIAFLIPFQDTCFPPSKQDQGRIQVHVLNSPVVQKVTDFGAGNPIKPGARSGETCGDAVIHADGGLVLIE
jgi:hypothetical protein